MCRGRKRKEGKTGEGKVLTENNQFNDSSLFQYLSSSSLFPAYRDSSTHPKTINLCSFIDSVSVMITSYTNHYVKVLTIGSLT